MKNILLLAGYRRSGKDRFFQTLNQNNDSKFYIFSQSRDFPSLSWKRFSFADPLKKECFSLYGIPTGDESKDKPLNVIEQVIFDCATPRDFWIRYGAQKTKEDSTYFAQNILKCLDKNICVTDWRKKVELEFVQNLEDLNIYTARVFSKNFIPDEKEIIEHELDDVKTDFLILRNLEDFDFAKSKFSFYKNYHFLKEVPVVGKGILVVGRGISLEGEGDKF